MYPHSTGADRRFSIIPFKPMARLRPRAGLIREVPEFTAENPPVLTIRAPKC
jgi:hypothetical protein